MIKPASLLFAASLAGLSASAQLPEAPTPQRPTAIRDIPLDVLHDEYRVITSPAHIHKRDLKYLIPLAAATAAGLTTDEKVSREVVSNNPSFNQSNINASNGMVGTAIAVPVLLFLAGQATHDERSRDTGILASEAMLEGFATVQASKLIFFRERPYVDNHQGEFFVGHSGADSSFASSHSVVAWASAAVIADRYRSPYVQAGVYTLATGVSLTRVLGQQHFPTDVLVGAATGWLIGHYVSRTHRRSY